MDKQQFTQLAEQGYQRIAMQRVILADFDTPLSIYRKCADKPFSYLFESVEGGEKWGRYSIIGLPCNEFFRINGSQIEHIKQGQVQQTLNEDDPLQWIKQFHQQTNVYYPDNIPHYAGGLVGYFAYDTIRYIEPKLGPCPHPDTIGTPDILLMMSDQVVVFDNLKKQCHIVLHINPEQTDAYDQAQQRFDHIIELIKQPLTEQTIQRTTPGTVASNVEQHDYLANVEKAKQYITDGDCMQIVYSQRLSVPFTEKPLHLYRALRHLNPSPYMYYLDLDDFHIVGSSPEILVRVEDGDITVRPIAGTRKRGDNAEQDSALAAELLADPKEQAEHLMLIDLGRNDVGRVSQTGTVQVTEHMSVEYYSHVMHIVSEVQGKIKPDCHPIDALRATLPAGTLSGAPKVRAMEIIDELEVAKRGIYGGAVGHLSWQGNFDTAIAIRTGVIKDQVLYTQAGGGLVYDSVPQAEFEESINKAKAVIKAAEMVNQGLILE